MPAVEQLGRLRRSGAPGPHLAPQPPPIGRLEDLLYHRRQSKVACSSCPETWSTRPLVPAVRLTTNSMRNGDACRRSTCPDAGLESKEKEGKHRYTPALGTRPQGFRKPLGSDWHTTDSQAVIRAPGKSAEYTSPWQLTHRRARHVI
jgi:hypothetical protein